MRALLADSSFAEGDLKAEFSKFGAVERVRVIRDKFTSKSRGFAFIGFSSGYEQALKVCQFRLHAVLISTG